MKKVVARKMGLTTKELNKKYFKKNKEEKTVEAVDEAKVLEAIEAGEYTAEELQKYLTVKEVVMLKLTDPAKVKK